MVNYEHYTTLKVDKKDRIATVILNRPPLNAINMTMHRELEDIWVDLMADDEVYAAVLTGAGRCFSAGGDIKEMVEAYKTGKPYTTLAGARRLIMNILDMEKPVIAAVNGDAIGLPANILLFSDIIIAAEDARLGDPHVSRIGVVAGDSGAIVWPLLAGINKAKELLLTGDLITAKEAERFGIVNHALPRSEVLPKAMEFARRLAFGPTRAIRWTKVCINKRLRDEVNLVLDASLGIEFAVTFWKEDHAEAVESFVEKRETQFKGLWP